MNLISASLSLLKVDVRSFDLFVFVDVLLTCLVVYD
jgi:hypothetical protein